MESNVVPLNDPKGRAADKQNAKERREAIKTAIMTAAASRIGLPPHVTIEWYAMLSGYTDVAIRRKIADAVWREGYEVFTAPDGHKMISVMGVAKWVEQERA